jgi:hypothetical protein
MKQPFISIVKFNLIKQMFIQEHALVKRSYLIAIIRDSIAIRIILMRITAVCKLSEPLCISTMKKVGRFNISNRKGPLP